MLRNRVTGEEREVDVVVRQRVAGHEMVLGVEATMRKGSSPWVEGMIGKHEELPTDRLVLVAERGFSRPARRYAARKGVAIIEPEDLTGNDPVLHIVNRLERMWPKGVALTPQHIRLLVLRPDGVKVRVREVPGDIVIYDEREREVSNAVGMFHTLLDQSFRRVAEQIGLAEINEDRDEFFTLRVGTNEEPLTALRYGEPLSVYARWELSDPPEPHQILSIEFNGRAVISVAEVRLTHRRFDESLVAYGQATFGGKEALFVVTENDAGGKMTIRTGKDIASDSTDDELDEGYARSADPELGQAGT